MDDLELTEEYDVDEYVSDVNPNCLITILVMMGDKWQDWLPNPPVMLGFGNWMLN